MDLVGVDLWFRSSSEKVLSVLTDRTWDYSKIDQRCPLALRALVDGRGQRILGCAASLISANEFRGEMTRGCRLDGDESTSNPTL